MVGLTGRDNVAHEFWTEPIYTSFSSRTRTSGVVPSESRRAHMQSRHLATPPTTAVARSQVVTEIVTLGRNFIACSVLQRSYLLRTGNRT
jgi:hypothetical protein